MHKADIKVGTAYALRERRGEPFQRVKILEHVRGGKWKAEWVEPNPGLIHYVESQNLIVPWRQLKAFLREESDKARLLEQSDRDGYQRDSPLVQAVEQVIDSVGETASFWRATLRAAPDVLERLFARSGIAANTYWPAAYTDRAGETNLPFGAAVVIAKAFCAAEPATVLLSIESTERKWTHDVGRGEDTLVPLLNEYRAAWAIIRQWTGHDPAIAQRELEIQKLERLVWDAIYALQKAGLESESARLRRAIQRGG
ncbi:MAG: hypothetical protein ABI665_23565 [Vicinamibacterales bacterium]